MSKVQKWFECYQYDKLPEGWTFRQDKDRRVFKSPQGDLIRSLTWVKQSIAPTSQKVESSSSKKRICEREDSSLPLEKTIEGNIISEVEFLDKNLILKQGLQK